MLFAFCYAKIPLSPSNSFPGPIPGAHLPAGRDNSFPGPIPGNPPAGRDRVVALSGNIRTCYLLALEIDSTNFTVMVDTASSNTVVPGPQINSYSGPKLDVPTKNSEVQANYLDGSWWRGFLTRKTVRISGFVVNGTNPSNVPIYVINSQSIEPAFSSNEYNGLIGLGYSDLAFPPYSPKTILDALLGNGKNAFGFHGCPYERSSESWIEFGADNYTTCGPIQYTISPIKSYVTINIINIYIQDTAVSLPLAFQTTDSILVGGDAKAWSILDSCSSLTYVPQQIITDLTNYILENGGLPSVLQTDFTKRKFLNGDISVALESVPKWHLLPTITIETVLDAAISSNSTGSLKLVLGPKHYIQSNGQGWQMTIASGFDTFATLGLPFFSAFYVSVHRDSGRVGFAPGCGCSENEYPKVIAQPVTIPTPPETAISATPYSTLSTANIVTSSYYSATSTNPATFSIVATVTEPARSNPTSFSLTKSAQPQTTLSMGTISSNSPAQWKTVLIVLLLVL